MSFCIHGLSVSRGLSGGIAIGRAVRILSSRASVAHYFVAPEETELEINRIRAARNAVVDEMQRLQLSLLDLANKDAPHELSAIMDVHLMLLQDETLADGVRHFIVERHYNAEWALTTQLEMIAQQFDAMQDPYMRERKGDLEQVVERVLTHLQGTAQLAHKQSSFNLEQEESLVLVAHDLSPADMIRFKSGVFTGFVTDVGGKTSHTAIVARSLGIPAIVGAKSASQLVRQDDWVIVDANAGVLVVSPTEQILNGYRDKQAIALQRAQEHMPAKHEPLYAPDGSVITLLANIELPSDAKVALDAGVQGIGLFRTEFLFMGRDQLPSEEEQYRAYKKVVQEMQGLPVTIRTIDIGADKPLVGNQSLGRAQPNPALGLRAIRWCLAEPAMFETQLRALLRAAVHGRIEVLIPMLAHESEIKLCLLLIDRARVHLASQGVAYGDIGIGAMIEVPAAALIVPIFLQYFDFLSIGTNDLTQYTLAVDRADESVAHLFDSSHPAVQFLIETTIKQCVAAKKSVSVCGEIAGDENHIKGLLDMGLRCFSMHPSQIALARKFIKELLASKNPAILLSSPSKDGL
jgi:phosphotransferase system enzyme I (PtsI)